MPWGSRALAGPEVGFVEFHVLCVSPPGHAQQWCFPSKVIRFGGKWLLPSSGVKKKSFALCFKKWYYLFSIILMFLSFFLLHFLKVLRRTCLVTVQGESERSHQAVVIAVLLVAHLEYKGGIRNTLTFSKATSLYTESEQGQRQASPSNCTCQWGFQWKDVGTKGNPHSVSEDEPGLGSWYRVCLGHTRCLPYFKAICHSPVN